jgi:hypothetical protein
MEFFDYDDLFLQSTLLRSCISFINGEVRKISIYVYTDAHIILDVE